MEKFIVYKHVSPSEKVYIGITKRNPERRWQNGSGYLNNDYFMKAIRKYGWENFKHEILFANLTKQEAEAKEIELISQYKSDQREFGYNIQHGGSSIGKHSEETKRKIGDANKGNTIWLGRFHSVESKRKLSLKSKGRKLTEETKKKISKAHSGKKLSAEHVEKIANSNRGKKRTSLQRAHISNSLKGHKGVNHTKETREAIAKKLAKPIQCVESGVVYKSIRDAERATGIDSGSIVKCLKGNLKTAGKFHWIYIQVI